MTTILDPNNRLSSLRVDGDGRLLVAASGVSSLPGTEYSFAGATLPSPWDTLGRAGTATYVDEDGLVAYGAHNLLSESEFRNGLSDAPVSGGLLSTASIDGFAGAIAFGDDGSTVSYAYKSLVGVVGDIELSLFVKMDDGGAPASNDFGIVINGAVTPYVTSTLYAPGIYRVTSIGTAAFNTFFGVAKYGGTSSTRTFKVTGYHLRHLPSAAAYIPTTTTPVYLPRQTHDPATLAPLGLLVEGQATNLLGATEAFNDAYWSNSSLAITADNVVAPDGSSGADLIVATTTAAEHYINSVPLPLTNGSYVNSFYVKAAGISEFSIATVHVGLAPTVSEARFTISSGVITSASISGAITSASATLTADGWYRCVVVYALSGTVSYHASRLYVGPVSASYVGNGIDGIYLWGAQLEAGTVATSYIPNPGTGTVVRTGDFAGGGITGSALTELFPEGFARNTIVFEFRKDYDGGTNEALLALSAGDSYSSGSGLLLRAEGGSIAAVGGNSSGVADIGIVTDGVTVNKIAISWDTATTTAAMSVNGRPPVTLGSLDFTGVGTTCLLLGALTTGGLQQTQRLTTPGIRVIPGQYWTGDALKFLST